MPKFLLVALIAFALTSPMDAVAANSVRGCLEFAYSKYVGEMTDEQAATLSFHACKVVSDLRVLEFLWAKHARRGFSPAHAMDFCIEVSPGSIDGKLEIVNHAFLVYSEAGLNDSAAATKAAFGASRITSLDCLVSRLSTFTRGQRTVKVIDSIFDACAAE